MKRKADQSNGKMLWGHVHNIFARYRRENPQTTELLSGCHLLVEEFQGEFWLVPRNSIHVNREWPLADRSPFQRRSQKNFCAEQQSSYGARSLLLACIIFLWIAKKKAQAFDSECFATFPYPTALSQNSNFGRKREDKSFYKRLVFCFDCLAQSPQSLF